MDAGSQRTNSKRLPVKITKMSVLASNRTESRFEAIVYSTELHDMLRELMQRNFGIKDLKHFARLQYAYGKDETENYERYHFLMTSHKKELDHLATLLTNNVRAANSIYPTNIREYEKRREYQNSAIVNCEQIIKELQHVVDTFNVDVNVYGKYIKAIDREIGLIKKWRQRDNKFKSYVKG